MLAKKNNPQVGVNQVLTLSFNFLSRVMFWTKNGWEAVDGFQFSVSMILWTTMIHFEIGTSNRSVILEVGFWRELSDAWQIICKEEIIFFLWGFDFFKLQMNWDNKIEAVVCYLIYKCEKKKKLLNFSSSI